MSELCNVRPYRRNRVRARRNEFSRAAMIAVFAAGVSFGYLGGLWQQIAQHRQNFTVQKGHR